MVVRTSTELHIPEYITGHYNNNPSNGWRAKWSISRSPRSPTTSWETHETKIRCACLLIHWWPLVGRQPLCPVLIWRKSSKVKGWHLCVETSPCDVTESFPQRVMSSEITFDWIRGTVTALVGDNIPLIDWWHLKCQRVIEIRTHFPTMQRTASLWDYCDRGDLGHFKTLRPRQMYAIWQTTFLSACSWMKMFEFLLKFHWSLFLRVELTIDQHWFR